jgi:hypothetical protein
MTMLKGYTTPNPGAGDGEYGSFGSCAGCEASQMRGFSASPAQIPYWEGQGIARTIPALNGFGFATEQHVETMQTQIEQTTGESVDLKMLAGTAFLGWFFGGNRGALIGAGVGFFYGKKLRAIATGASSLVAKVADPSVAGFGASHSSASRDRPRRGGRVLIPDSGRDGEPRGRNWFDGFGNALVMNPKGVPCPPDSGTWCMEYREQPTGSTIPTIKQVTTVVDLISGSIPATVPGPTSTGPGPNVVPFQPPPPGNYVQQQTAPLDVTMIGVGAAAGFLFKGSTGALIGAAIAAYFGSRGRSDVNLVQAQTQQGGAIVGGLKGDPSGKQLW